MLLWERDQLCNRIRICCHVPRQIEAKRSRRRKIEGKGERKVSPKGKWRRQIKGRNGMVTGDGAKKNKKRASLSDARPKSRYAKGEVRRIINIG